MMMDRRPPRQDSPAGGLAVWGWFAVWAGWIAIARLLQRIAGAAENPFSGQPDSSGHFVNALLGWNYLRAGIPGDPIEFAKLFYVHYPGVAIGQWPPGYAAAAALWSLAFSPSPGAVMWMQAIAMGAAATLACRLLQPEIGWLGTIVATALFIVSAPSQLVVSGVMAEPLTAALCLVAVSFYASYLNRPRGSAALLFGLAAGAALLTKGVAIGLALLPLAAVLCRRSGLLRRWHFWAPAGIVLLTAGPWYLGLGKLGGWGSGFRFGAEQVVGRAIVANSLSARFPFKAEAALGALGWGLAGLCLLGLAAGFFRPAIERRLQPTGAILGVYVLAAFLCHGLLRESSEPRHLLHALAPTLGFAFLGARTVVTALIGEQLRYATIASVALIGVCSFGRWQLIESPDRGFGDAVNTIRSDAALDEAVILVSSSSGGEVIFVAELAAREPSPRRVVLRGSKVLARSGWNARSYAVRLESANEVEAYLDSIPVGIVVVDSRPGSPRIRHHGLLRDAVLRRPESWHEIPTNMGAVRVFRSTRPDLRQAAPVKVDLTDRIGKVLEIYPGQPLPWTR